MHSRTSPKAAQARERERQALAMRRAGARYEAIAEELGYANHTGAYKAVQRAFRRLEARVAEDAAMNRSLDLGRLDEAIAGLVPQVREGNDRAVKALVAVLERRAKLLGLDAPTKTDLTTDGRPMKALIGVELERI